jgi:hypothetical protein
MEEIVLVTMLKIITVAMVLGAASVSDLISRRVEDRYWILLVLAGLVPLIYEIFHRVTLESPATYLSLLLPLGFMAFAIFGYPEAGKIIKGSVADIGFAVFYILAGSGTVIAFIAGDPSVVARIGYSFVFMLIYFLLYSFPIGGTRIIHGGADAKCMMALALLFPWYGEPLPISTGPFYELLAKQGALEFFIPYHLSVMLNGAIITVIFLAVYLPARNILSGDMGSLNIFTSYKRKVSDLQGRFVWVYMVRDRKTVKEDPTPELIRELKNDNIGMVRVTPKIPFIFSLTLGFVIQVILGNLGLLAALLIT